MSVKKKTCYVLLVVNNEGVAMHIMSSLFQAPR